MGEKEKKPEEKKPEEAKAAEEKKEEAAAKPAEEKKKEEPKAEEQPAPPPPPPQEIVLKVYMHCEGCARKVRRCLKGFDGVEDVITDCKTSKVVVKGEKADPLKVLGRIQRKSHRQVELISPIPPPPEEPKKAEEKPLPKPEDKKEELPVITVVLGVYMHCEACAQEIKKRILKMKGVESVVPDLKSSQVTVKGVFSPENLTEYVHKRTGKHAVVVKVEPEKKEEEKTKEKKKPEEPEKEAKKDDSVKDTASAAAGGEAAAKAVGEVAEDPKLELKKNEFLIYYPHHENLQTFYPPPRIVQEYYQHEYHQHEYPPQIFSDENPNACSVM